MKHNKLLLFSGIFLMLVVFSCLKPLKANAAIAYRSSSTASVPGGTSISIAMPTGTVQGDVMVASIFANGNQAAVLGITPPAGWTQVQKVDNQTGQYYPMVSIFTKPAGASESGPYVFTFSNYSGAAYGGGWIASFTGVNTTTPVDVSGSQNVPSGTSYSTPSITTTADNEMLVFAYAGNCATSGFNIPTAPISASVISGNINGGCTTGSGFYEARAVAGSGAISTTAITSSYGGAVILALKNTNTAPTITSNPSSSYGSKTRTGSSNTPWTMSFLATDGEQTGAGQLTYYVHTQANRAGTQVATGTFQSGSGQNISIAYNAAGLASGSNTLYLSIYDGTLYSATNPSFAVLRDDVNPTSSTRISTGSGTLTTSTYAVTFTASDALSTNGNELAYSIRTAAAGGGIQLTSGTATSATPKTTGSFADSTLTAGLNTRYVRICDGANNCSDTGFPVYFAPVPSGGTTSTATNVASYYATLNGAANPNGVSTTGHFRVYTYPPSNCNSDTGGFRYPESAIYDVQLGSGTISQNFSYTIPPSSSAFLLPGVSHWYCSFAVNVNGTAGSASSTSIPVPDGPASPCDPPISGNLTLSTGSACAFTTTATGFSGVDSGTGTKNTAAITLNSGAALTVSPSQQIAFGSLGGSKGSSITMQRGATLRGGPLYVRDKDGDGIIDDQTQYIGSTSSATTEFVRRNTLNSANYNYAWKIASSGAAMSFDCDNTSAFVFRKLPSTIALVVDADNDGYKTAAAATTTACVGSSFTTAGRVYYKDSSNAFSWLTDAHKLSATADCLDTGTGGQGQAAASVYQNFTGYSDADNDNYTINSTATICSGSVILAYNSVTNPYRGSLSSPVDCQDNPNGTPCTPVSTSASNPSSQSQNSLSWAVNPNGGAVPAASSGYDIFYCSGANPCTTGASKISVGAGITSTTHSGLAAGTWYGYNFVAKNGAGSSTASSPNNYAQTLASCTTGFKDYDGDGYGAGSSACWNPSASYVVVASGGDCYDYDGANTTIENQSKLAKPGQTTYYTVVRGTASGVNDWAGQSYNSYDYNCDGNYTNTLTNTTTAPGSMPSRTYCSGGGPFTVNSYEAVSCAATCPPYYDCCSWNYACTQYKYCSNYTTAAIACGSSYSVYKSGPTFTSHTYSASCGGSNNNVSGYYGTIDNSTQVTCR